MKRTFPILILALIVVLVLSGCTQSKPVITIDGILRTITEEEYENIYTDDIENPQIENFKYYELRVKGNNLKNIELRDVIVPEFKYISKELNEYNSDIWALGNTLIQDNTNEDFFVYEYKVLLNMTEITADELKDVLDEFEVKVHIETKDGYEIKEEYNLGEELKL
ncbi:hypothetical protein SH2C18_34730 [Clostridium sediminicola]|uniref:hypothetical protein n=1 Tax=Clostridium sediminicola TaxID=3114879 RepID=UPI0031F23E5C